MTKRTLESARDQAQREWELEPARRALLKWFDRYGRALPWRDDPNPYRVWVSEIMLQQTTTQTVAGYFDRFLTQFPNASALARADEADVLKAWQGLGYYRRARAMRDAAKIVVERYNGELPGAREELEALPGIGRYAAGAILSFGFDRRAPILEANTTRLHARLLALEDDPTVARAQAILWRFAEAWLPRESPRRAKGVYRRVNSALTDLGRMVCAPNNPLCETCPIAEYCRAYDAGRQYELPRYKPKRAPTPRLDVALWITRDDLGVSGDPNDVLLVKRPKEALWGGLWDLPRFVDVGAQGEATALGWSAKALDQAQAFLETEIGVAPRNYRLGPVITTFKHAVTRFRVTLALCRLADSNWYATGASERTLFDLNNNERFDQIGREDRSDKKTDTRVAEEWRWVKCEELEKYPMSTTGRKLAEFIKREAQVE